MVYPIHVSTSRKINFDPHMDKPVLGLPSKDGNTLAINDHVIAYFRTLIATLKIACGCSQEMHKFSESGAHLKV